MQTAAPDNIVPYPRTPARPPLIPHGPLLLDARPGDAFFIGDDSNVLFVLLSSPQIVADGRRRWCVAIASNDPMRPVGTLCAEAIETRVCPVRALDMRIVREPLAWTGR